MLPIVTGRDPTLDRVFLEVRFPQRLAFIDHVGLLADGFDEAFEEGQIGASEVKLSDSEEGTDVTLTPERIQVSHGHGDALWAVETLATAVGLYGKAIGLEAVEFVGVRQFFIEEVGGVSDATALFRAMFFDYRTGPVTAFGSEAIEARATVGYRIDDGVCRLQATAISRRGEAEALAPSEPPGALLLDVDRTHDRGTDAWSVRETVESLLTDGRARAVDFVARLKTAGLMPDREVSDHGGDRDSDR